MKIDVSFDLEIDENAWALEYGIPKNSKNWLEEIRKDVVKLTADHMKFFYHNMGLSNQKEENGKA